MIFNNEIRIQRKISRRTELFFILNSIRENIESHRKKRNKKRNVTTY